MVAKHAIVEERRSYVSPRRYHMTMVPLLSARYGSRQSSFMTDHSDDQPLSRRLFDQKNPTDPIHADFAIHSAKGGRIRLLGWVF